MYRLAYSAIPSTVSVPTEGGLAKRQKAPAFENDLQTLESDMRRVGATPNSGELISDLNNLRTIKLPRLVSDSANAEFFVAFGPGDVITAKFISGSDSLKGAAKRLETSKFNVLFPGEHPARILRRGILGCNQYSGCSFVMIPPPAVFSLQ